MRSKTCFIGLRRTRMHSSRMRTGRTLTVFRKIGDPLKNWRPPSEKLETPPGTRPPPETDLQDMLGYPPPGTDLQGMLGYPPTPPPWTDRRL